MNFRRRRPFLAGIAVLASAPLLAGGIASDPHPPQGWEGVLADTLDASGLYVHTAQAGLAEKVDSVQAPFALPGDSPQLTEVTVTMDPS